MAATLESRTSQFLTKGDTLSPEEFGRLVTVHTKGMNLEAERRSSNESCQTSITEPELGPKHLVSERHRNHVMVSKHELIDVT